VSGEDLQYAQEQLDGHGLVRGLDLLSTGHVRIETMFLYPDGSSVDVFLVREADSPLLPPSRLTDLGQTMAWLLTMQVKPRQSKKRQALLEDALRLYRVEQRRGELVLPLEVVNDDIVQGVLGLGQACVRAADLSFTRRSSLYSPFRDEVEEVLVDTDLFYEPDVELVGRFEKRVPVDFLVHGPAAHFAILGLSSGSASAAHVQANEIFRKWFDLDIPERPEGRVTVFDDRVDVYRDDDLKRLETLSSIVALSDRQALLWHLTAH
jgi:hypothetical protein